MKKIFQPVFFIIFIPILLIACGPKTGLDLSDGKLCNPHSLEIDSTGSHYTRIAWNPGCPGVRIMRGFNIYLSPTPIVSEYSGHELPESIKPYNNETYPGDPEGNEKHETFEFKDLPLAERYYAHVRVINSDGSLSLPSNEIEIVQMPQGIMTLGVSYSGNNEGFSFENDAYCGTDDVENDLYFYSKNGSDYLCSPARISAVNRANKIYFLGQGESLGDVSNISSRGESVQKIAMIPGEIFVIETEDGYFAKLRLIRMTGSGDYRTAVFEYFYQAPIKKGVA
ncbi:MAG: hypothetical protein V3V99_02515 [candidate division Zixibacteria bacterium]